MLRMRLSVVAVFGVDPVCVEKRLHIGIAFTIRVTVHERKIDNYHFVCEPCEVECVCGLFVLVGPNVVRYINGVAHSSEATVANKLHAAFRRDVQAVVVFAQVEIGFGINQAACDLALVNSVVCRQALNKQVVQTEREMVLALFQLVEVELYVVELCHFSCRCCGKRAQRYKNNFVFANICVKFAANVVTFSKMLVGVYILPLYTNDF